MSSRPLPPFLASERVYLIAEAEINHNGRLETALDMVDTARSLGADAVKFQYVVADEIATRDSPYHALFKSVELSEAEFTQVFARAAACGIDCFITVPSVATLEPVLRLGPPILKVGSTNLTNIPLLREIGRTKVPVLFSTGLGTLGEIEDALEALDATPERVGFFHCTVKYPAPVGIVNLRAIPTMKSAFPGYAIGYSDHTEGDTAAVAAVALGARMIEKHFTLDRTQAGPDHAFSLDPPALARFVGAVRDAEAALGHGIKRAAGEEAAAIRGGRRYLVAAGLIARGEALTPANLVPRRIPADEDGIAPGMLDHIAGWQAPRDYRPGEALSWSHFRAAQGG